MIWYSISIFNKSGLIIIWFSFRYYGFLFSFYLFLKLKSILKGFGFQSKEDRVENVLKNSRTGKGYFVGITYFCVKNKFGHFLYGKKGKI